MKDWRSAIDHQIESLSEDLRAIRRHLHAHPEPSLEEFETTIFLARQLKAAGIPYEVIPSGRGIIAGPEPKPGTPLVAIRADMDALPIQDIKTVDYRSSRVGVMHACGHDAHSTMALGAALALSRSAAAMPWPVSWRLLLQPAEEVGVGAAEMVAAGAIDGVDSIVALHVAPEIRVGRVASRSGVMTAYCQDLDVEVRGQGGHAARPHLASDPIAAAAQFVAAVYQGLPRAVDAREAVVVSFTAIEAGRSYNVIPNLVHLRGTIRTLGLASATRVHDRLERIARGVAEATGTTIALGFGHATGAVFNDDAVYKICTRAAAEVVGVSDVEEIPLPSMGGEDFSGYLDRTPGCLLRLGVADGKGGPWPLLHTPDFDIDERALGLGARILARSAILLAHRGAGPVDVVEAR